MSILVGNLLEAKFHRGVWNIWGRAHLGKFYGCGQGKILPYDDRYMRWTMLHQKRDQTMSKFKNTFHTLCTKLGIKDSEQHLVLKYRGALHKYIQTKMEFMGIS
jgi:hypothetical protein